MSDSDVGARSVKGAGEEDAFERRGPSSRSELGEKARRNDSIEDGGGMGVCARKG